MRSWLIGLAAALGLWCCAQAQESGKLRLQDEDSPPPLAPARYEIHARLDLAKALIRGDWELEYRHVGKDTLRELMLNQPRWRSGMRGDSTSVTCIIDSLLVNGTPAEGLHFSRDSSTIRLPLPRPLFPDSSVFLLAGFTTVLPPKIDSHVKPGEPVVVLSGWHPTIARREKGKWLTGDQASRSGWVGEVGDFVGVAVRVEGGIELAGPGELINGKLLYGTRPPSRRDTMYEYVARSDGGRETGMPATADVNAERTYTWRVRGVRAFGLGIGRELGCDSWTRSERVYYLWRPTRVDSALLKSIRAGVDRAIRDVGQDRKRQPSTFRIVIGCVFGTSGSVDGMAVLGDGQVANEKQARSSIVRQIRTWDEAVTKAIGR